MLENNEKYFTVLKDLKMEFPILKGKSARNLQKFATEFDNDEFLQHHVAKLPWSSITTIMGQVKDTFVLEFLNIKENTDYLESDLENTRKYFLQHFGDILATF